MIHTGPACACNACLCCGPPVCAACNTESVDRCTVSEMSCLQFDATAYKSHECGVRGSAPFFQLPQQRCTCFGVTRLHLTASAAPLGWLLHARIPLQASAAGAPVVDCHSGLLRRWLCQCRITQSRGAAWHCMGRWAALALVAAMARRAWCVFQACLFGKRTWQLQVTCGFTWLTWQQLLQRQALYGISVLWCTLHVALLDVPLWLCFGCRVQVSCL